MHIGFILFSLNLLFSLQIPSCCVARDTIRAGEALVGDDKLVSPNGRFVLGFYQPSGQYSRHHTPKHWYLGVWFDKISKITPIWIANRENPIVGHHRMSKLTISGDGNLVIVNQATESMVWSTRANVTAENTTAVLQNSGNLVLRGASNNTLWQSFDHPTDVILNGAKIGLNKVTGLNSRIVSKKNLIDPAPGLYCLELDPAGAGQFVLKLRNSSIVYWSTGEWNGQYFNLMPFWTALVKSSHLSGSRSHKIGRKFTLDLKINVMSMLLVDPSQSLDCSTRNQSRTATTDKFYTLPAVGLPAKPNTVESAHRCQRC